MDQKNIFQDLVESTGDLVVRLDQTGRVSYISPSTKTTYGVPPADCLGKKALYFVHPADRKKTLADIARLAARRAQSATLQNRYVDSAGKTHHIMWNLNFRYGRGKGLKHINAFGRDITPHMALERELRDSRQMWNNLFMASPAWILLASLEDGRFLDCNHTFCQDTGYSRNEVLGRTTMELGLWSGPRERNAILGLLKTRERIDKHPLQMRLRDGVLRDFLWSAVITQVTSRDCLLSVLVDVSRLKEAETRLLEANRALEARTGELVEMNSALKVLLKQREEDKSELESRVWHNLNKMVQPHIHNLRQTGLTPTQTAHLDVVAGRLKEITNSLGRRLGLRERELTPRELELAGLIIEGRTNKEIAAILNISVFSVHSHRQGIREKLGLLGSRKNLRVHLARLSQ